MDPDRRETDVAVVGDDERAEDTARGVAAAESRIDADVLPPEAVAETLRERGVDCVVVHDTGAVEAVLSRVREAAPDVPTLVVTDDPEVAADALEAGADDFLLDEVDGGIRVLATRIVSALAPRDRIDDELRELLSIASTRDTTFTEKVDAALELGCDRLDLNIGFVSAIDRDFEVLAARGDHPKIQPGSRDRLSRTYCRKAIENDAPLAVRNAPEEMAGDPAFERYGLSCYLGAKVVVDGELYGTLCFADTEKRRHFSGAEVTLVDLMAKWVGYELERKNHVEELRAQNERFEDLARTLSHDLGNLLEVLRGHVEYAAETGDLDRLDRAMTTHDRTSELLEKMVTLTRAGKRIDDATAVDLRTVTEEAWTHVERDDAELELAVDDGTTVTADRGRLLQLLENLINNSIQHTGPGVTVRIGTFDGGFYVADDGAGIPEGEREGLFEAGVSAADDGGGLGLSIVERIAAAHGWSTRATGSEAGGARFEVTGVPGLRRTAGDDRVR